MSKRILQQYVFKINSSRLRNHNWNLQNLFLQQAKENEELIALADSTTLRFIREITNTNIPYDEIKQIRDEIKMLKSDKANVKSGREIKKLYQKLDDLLFVKDYVCIVMENNKDFDRINKGFHINNIKFKRLLATTGGVKNNTVIYVNEEIYEELNRRLDNGRNMSKKIVPAKLEAYKSLACSSSIPIDFEPTFKKNKDGEFQTSSRVLVIPDVVTKFTADIIKLDDAKKTPPDVKYVKDHEIELEDSDGYGLISPKLSKDWTKQVGDKKDGEYISSGFCIRNSFCKGMLFTFDFHKFAREIADNDTVVDVWGNEVNINDIDIILTTSMLKLHDSYNSINHYLDCCKENGYSFSITKVIPKELENQRNLNYQFIQPLELDDNDIDELIKPTVEEIKDVLGGDYRKTILFLKGIHLTDKNVNVNIADLHTALMIDKRMIDDPFVRRRVHSMIKKRIDDAKVGVLKTNGNFQIISGDPYSLCQSIFNLEVTGLLKANEFYSEYWNERNIDKVAAFRAPMTCHNNIRLLNLKNTDEMRNWYYYMNRCIILNSWDTTTHALNGADKDSDTVLTTDNPVILKGIRKTDAILCVQSTAKKIIPSEKDLIKSNKDGFGNAIGTITNRITSMFAVQAQFDKNSEEYKTLESRIMWGQHYQQLAIDKIKGIIGKSMPNEWFNYHANIIKEDDVEETKKEKEFNIRILADKKPYFMTYIYPREMKKYKTHISKTNRNCIVDFGITLDELINKKRKTEVEKTFLHYYYKKMPVNTYPSLMNKICYKIEEEFDGIFKSFDRNFDFDYSILKCPNVEPSKSNHDKVKEIYNQYKKRTQQYKIEITQTKNEEYDYKEIVQIFTNNFKNLAYSVCNDEKELCNIVLDLCYTNNDSKQFAWDICGDTIIKNLLELNSYKIKYPSLDGNGDIEFGGFKFSMQEKTIIREEV